MSSLRFPRALRSTLRQRRSTENPEQRVKSLLKQIDPVHKEVVQRKLFVDQHTKGMDGSSLLQGIDIDPVLRSELEMIYDTPVRKIDHKRHHIETQFVPHNLESSIKSLKSKTIAKSHEYFLKSSSIMILVHDNSNTTTNLMFRNKIANRIKAISTQAQTVSTRNVDPSTLSRLLPSNTNLVEELLPLRNTTLKALCVPPHAIETTPEILSIIQSQSPLFEPIGIILNIATSSRLAIELQGALKNNSQTHGEINYESLIKIAQRSHEDTKEGVATNVLRKVGEGAFLDVVVAENYVTLTKTKR